MTFISKSEPTVCLDCRRRRSRAFEAASGELGDCSTISSTAHFRPGFRDVYSYDSGGAGKNAWDSRLASSTDNGGVNTTSFSPSRRHVACRKSMWGACLMACTVRMFSARMMRCVRSSGRVPLRANSSSIGRRVFNASLICRPSEHVIQSPLAGRSAVAIVRLSVAMMPGSGGNVWPRSDSANAVVTNAETPMERGQLVVRSARMTTKALLWMPSRNARQAASRNGGFNRIQ